MPRVASKACKALSLPADFHPVTKISQIFTGLKLKEIVSCLRSSTDETAEIICALYDRLSPPLAASINIDYLLAAAHCKDAHVVAGLICEQYSRVKSLETNIIASRESPGIMKDFAEKAKRKNGFQHGKLILQASGVAPVPKNQVTHVSMIGSKIDNSKNVNFNNVPSQHTVVNEVSEILRQLPIHASSPDHSEENPGHREG